MAGAGGKPEQKGPPALLLLLTSVLDQYDQQTPLPTWDGAGTWWGQRVKGRDTVWFGHFQFHHVIFLTFYIQVLDQEKFYLGALTGIICV